MKITCVCGSQIVDGTDNLPDKAHIIGDQVWLAMLEEIDAAIERCGVTEKDREAASMGIREAILRRSSLAWQCSQCGRLYVEDGERELHQFKPDTATASRAVFIRKR